MKLFISLFCIFSLSTSTAFASLAEAERVARKAVENINNEKQKLLTELNQLEESLVSLKLDMEKTNSRDFSKYQDWLTRIALGVAVGAGLMTAYYAKKGGDDAMAILGLGPIAVGATAASYLSTLIDYIANPTFDESKFNEIKKNTLRSLENERDSVPSEALEAYEKLIETINSMDSVMSEEQRKENKRILLQEVSLVLGLLSMGSFLVFEKNVKHIGGKVAGWATIGFAVSSVATMTATVWDDADKERVIQAVDLAIRELQTAKSLIAQN